MRGSEEPRRPFTVSRRDFLAAAGVTIAVTALPLPLPRHHRSPAPSSLAREDRAGGGPGLTFPPRLAQLQPKSAADVQALLDYDVTKDPGARYLRCQVPIASRATVPAAAQANPKLDQRPRILSLNGYYNQFVADAPWIGDTRYGYDQRPYITRFAQYQDYLGGWTGAQAIPNPAYVDVAHRHGALGLGIIFQPYFSPAPGDATDFVARDSSGNFVVGDKLVDLAAYFGYDGYFLNIEELKVTAEQASELAEMFDGMHERAQAVGMPTFYLQIYDALWTSGDPDGTDEYENRFDEHNAGWIAPGKRVDSIFINYAWPQHFPEPDSAHSADYVAPSVALADELGLDPFEVLFFGLDVEEENDGVHANALDYYADQVVPLNGDGPALASLALFAQSDRLFIRTRDQLGSAASDVGKLEAAIYVGDRKFWSGKAENPAVPAVPVHPTAEEVVSPDWMPRYGVANFIPERTVIASVPFTTHFNCGQGDSFFLSGAPAGQRVWYNMSAQDPLPSWQWWTRSLSGAAGAPGLLAVDYEQSVAYDGGTCLSIDGELRRDGGTEVRLFATAIDAGQPAVLSLVAREGTPGALDALRAGVSYVDQPSATEWLTPEPRASEVGPGWQRVEFPIQARPGSLITALGVGVDVDARRGDVRPHYTVYIGELRIASRSPIAPPAAPRGLSIDATTPSSDGQSLTVGLAWQLDADGVSYYDLRTATGAPQWLGRIFGDAYVLDGISRGTRIALVAVGPDGGESAPALVTAG